MGGLRGDAEGTFELAHAVRDGRRFGAPRFAGERYDLVVVGAGLSGLAAACFFRKRRPRGRVLLLDCRDDFGGHCQRNEFRLDGRLLLGYGGGQSIDAPSTYTAEGRALLAEAGVDLKRFETAFDQELYFSRGKPAVFFDRETFGEDRLARGAPRQGPGERPSGWREFLARSPLPDFAREDIRRLYEDDADPWPGVGPAEKARRLKGLSYRDYLLGPARAHPLAAAFFQAQAHDEAGLGADAVSAWWSFTRGRAGFWGLGLQAPPDPKGGEPYIYHFPDGNAGLARLLVRLLAPEAVPGSTMEDSVTAAVDYARLDDPKSPARVRLGATVLRVRAEKGGAEVHYVRGGAVLGVRAAAVVLACDHAMIPHLLPELPGEQRAALREAVRIPIVYTSVLVRDASAFSRLGVSEIHCPGAYHSSIELDYPVSLGAYRCPRDSGEPAVLHLLRVPARPGAPPTEQFRAGRAELLATPFWEIEGRTRDQLRRALGAGGFEPDRHIAAITVNRWAHGYASGQAPLVDGRRPAGRPWELARRRFGRVSIAGSDASGVALAQAAIAEAHRAVSELL
ncbi:MAG: NAD(P)-binding protein [Elusimicrobia bacterium]|nr:NAD(P)-binding protein [Elusimicrobiota bacterium]